MSSKVSPKVLASLLLGVALVGAAAIFAWRHRERQVTFDVEVYVPAGGARALVLTADGREVLNAALAPGQRKVHVAVPGRPARELSADMIPNFAARAQGPCGWHDAHADVETPLAAVRRQMDSGTASLQVNISVAAPSQSITLWVDNRGHPPVKVVVGGEERGIAEDEKGSYLFSYETSCASGREVRVDGVLAGVLPETIEDPGIGVEYDPRDLKWSHRFFVDTTAQRCYAYNEHCFVPKASEGCFVSGPTMLRRKLFHRIPMNDPDFFLEDVPKQITAYMTQESTMAMKYSLKQASCGGDWD